MVKIRIIESKKSGHREGKKTFLRKKRFNCFIQNMGLYRMGFMFDHPFHIQYHTIALK